MRFALGGALIAGLLWACVGDDPSVDGPAVTGADGGVVQPGQDASGGGGGGDSSSTPAAAPLTIEVSPAGFELKPDQSRKITIVVKASEPVDAPIKVTLSGVPTNGAPSPLTITPQQIELLPENPQLEVNVTLDKVSVHGSFAVNVGAAAKGTTKSFSGTGTFSVRSVGSPAQLDTGFTSKGYVDFCPLAEAVCSPGALHVYPDGRVLVVGSSQGHFLATRYLPDGQTDTTFGTNGVVDQAVDVPEISEIIRLADDSFIVGNIANGKLDLRPMSAVGVLGTVLPDSLSAGVSATGHLVATADGFFVTGGSVGAVVRAHRLNGTVNTGLFTEGVRTEAFQLITTSNAIVLDATNQIYFAGGQSISQINDYETYIARLTSTGAPAPPFGGENVTEHHTVMDVPYAYDQALGIAVHGTGTVVVGAEGTTLFRIFKINGSGNIEILPKSVPNMPIGLLVEPDQSILYSNATTIKRLKSNLEDDLTFGTNGVLPRVAGSNVQRIALSENGRELVVLARSDGPARAFRTSRYWLR